MHVPGSVSVGLMKVTHSVDSGIAAALRPTTVDSANLSESDKAELASLVAQAKGDQGQLRTGSGYEVLSVEEGQQRIELRQPVTDMSESSNG